MSPYVPSARAVFLLVLVALSAGLSPRPAQAQSATLTGPDRAEVGASITISWTGPSAAGEFISIDPAGAPPASYGQYVYANSGQTGTLPVPDVPGSYLLRYHTGASGYPVIASRPIEVTDVTAELDGDHSLSAAR